MGQAQSDVSASEAASDDRSRGGPSASPSAGAATTMDSLIAEAAAYADDENESLDAKAQKALECPCIADLRSGPCGNQFSEAFVCFLKSTTEEKGSDCVNPFVALQNCIKANPGAFSKDVLEGDDDDVKKEEELKQEYRIIPPTWSKESHKAKSKL
ncbi:mitochondrial intermembrane space import and assembly protein 40 homolog [Rhodamnia argentea]|uniref:Mitochondrial intermembrane space import and assembly protein 40 homolog n=1 Tax=Rhodamnia argentea TaxID=178133 RepID=A0A8B8QBV5_9MYRT|nr:mitochondrial intermembrane space import and assembly protein 40 homolog [Rhodamnia argentea]